MGDEAPKPRKKSTSVCISVPSAQRAVDETECSDEAAAKSAKASGLRVGSLLRVWAEVSRINYFTSQPLDIITLGRIL